MKNKIIKALKNPNKILLSLGSRGYLKFLSDRFF